MKKRIVLISLVVALGVLAWVFVPLSVREMGSVSMAPLIAGQGSPPTKTGDRVLLLTMLRFTKIEVGDLVLVEIPTATGPVETIRRVQSISVGSEPHYSVESLHPDGIDSRHFGDLRADKVKAKVLHVFRS